MLTNVHIKNFRSCKDVKLEGLGSMLGLVGRNAAGKTTILEGIEGAARLAMTDDSFRQLSYGLGVRLDEWSMEATVGGRGFRYARKHAREELDVREVSGGAWTRALERDGRELRLVDQERRLVISDDIAAMPALASLLPPDDAINRVIEPLRVMLKGVHYYPGHDQEWTQGAQIEPHEPISLEEFERWTIQPDKQASSILMRLIHARTRERPLFDELRELMGERGLDLVRDIIISELRDSDGQTQYYDVDFWPSGLVGRRPCSLWQLSGGTRRILYLLAGLLFDRRSVMLIEQPEDGIHPALLYKVIDLLRVNADPTQIFFTSHSPTVLSSLRPQDVRLVAMKDGATDARALTAAEVQHAEEYMRREGSLAEYLELIQED